MILTKRYKFILSFLLVSFGVFAFLQQAQACVGTGLFDYSSAVLDALDFIDMAVLKVLVTIMIFTILSSAYVVLAAFLVQWSSQLPLYLDAPVVQGGWYFILGLCNLFIILAMVFIALAYILKIESLELKKTLPKLLIVIVLVNFSMLITGIFVDIAQFFMNTFQAAYGTDFIEMAIFPLRNSVGALTTILSTTIMGYVASAFIPFGSIITLAIILASFLAGDLLGSMFTAVVLIFLNISLGTTFFVYFVLFIVRIAYLWLLTIFSPLAFLAFVFKQTQGYGKKWFTAVVQWASLGVILFFLLGLITTLFYDAFVERPGDIEIKGAAGLPVLNLPSQIYNYLFLLLFLLIAYKTSISLAPAGAKQFAGLVEGQLKSMGGVAGIAKKISKRATRAQTERMQEAGANLAGRLPVVGRDIKANYRQKRAKEVGEESKKLEYLSDQERQKIIDSPWSSTLQKQAALEVNAKKGSLRPQDETHIKRAVAYGADSRTFTNAMPTLAGELQEIKEGRTFSQAERDEAIRTAVMKQSPKNFAENVQANTFSTDGRNAQQIHNIHVAFQSMDYRKTIEIGEKGSGDLKRNIANYVDRELRGGGHIRRDLNSLVNSLNVGTPEERDRANRDLNNYRDKLGNIANNYHN